MNKANPRILTRDECRYNVNLSVRRAPMRREGWMVGSGGSVWVSGGSFHYYVISAHTHHDALAPCRTGEAGEGKQWRADRVKLRRGRRRGGETLKETRLYLSQRCLPFSRERRHVPRWGRALKPRSWRAHRPLVCHPLSLKGHAGRETSSEDTPVATRWPLGNFLFFFFLRRRLQLWHHHHHNHSSGMWASIEVGGDGDFVDRHSVWMGSK